MGALYLDGILQPDPLPCGLPADLIGCVNAKPVRQRIRLQPVKVDIGQMMDDAAAAAVELMIDARSRRFRGQPNLLDQKIEDGLSRLGPVALIERADFLLKIERKELRLLGFGGENFEISLRAARRFGEWLLAEQGEAA